MKRAFTLASLILSVALVGCERAQEAPAAKNNVPPAATKKTESRPESPGTAGGAKPEPSGTSSHGGEVIELGTSKIGGFDVRASRDKGEIKEGGDAPVDVWINGGVGDGVTAVRFWIGLEDARQSIKARAEIEKGKWHNHVEVPSPIPSGAKLWVEIEMADTQEMTGSFDLKN